MKRLFDFLIGKKTYILAFAGAIYATGISQNLWPHLVWLDILLGSAATATIRHGIATTGLTLLLALALLPGCAYHCSKLYDPDTGKLVGKLRSYTLFDSESSLAKAHIDTRAVTNSHGTFSPGISISGMNQQSSASNLVTIVIKGAGLAIDAAK